MAGVFAPGSHFDLYTPFPLSPGDQPLGQHHGDRGPAEAGRHWYRAAQAEIRTLAPRMAEASIRRRNDFEGFVTPLKERVGGRIRPALLVLAIAVGVVMLIVCANLSNLLLARTATRQKELAVRTALGAGRWRLFRQMLTEGLTLSGGGAVLGVALAWGGTRLMSSLQGLKIPLLANIRLDASVLGFSLLAAVATGVIFGLAPALLTPSVPCTTF